MRGNLWLSKIAVEVTTYQVLSTKMFNKPENK